MGKQSRKKRERRLRKEALNAFFNGRQFPFDGPDQSASVEKRFAQDVARVENVLRKYVRIDAAIALGVSDLWPQNAASPVKHLLAWAVLLGLDPVCKGLRPINTYADFRQFAEELYGGWPSFPMLEDFSPEADWGQIRIRLGSEYVPMFYGGPVERTPDFVEAFRITQAGNTAALADMDLAVAIQADLIRSIPSQMQNPPPQPDRGYVEVPPLEFWDLCHVWMRAAGPRVSPWRAKASAGLTMAIGSYRAPLTWSSFGDAVLMGQMIPFLGVTYDDFWIPISVRSDPGVVIDRWANLKPQGITYQSHKALGQFVANRFARTLIGPMTLAVRSNEFNDLPVSCVVVAAAKVYLFCLCDQQSLKAANTTAKSVYAALRSGGPMHLLLGGEQAFALSNDGRPGPSADDLRVVIVLSQSGTGFGTLDAPERPTRLLPLADFISVFDSLEDLEELERFWEFSDKPRSILAPLSRGAADLFGAFKDTHGVLVDGAVAPSLIALDPHWGSSWRFRVLAAFWAEAPRRFPDNSNAWRVSRTVKGVSELRSRRHAAMAYSTEIGTCTVQAVVPIESELDIHDSMMLDLFAQMVIDALHEYADQLNGSRILQTSQLVLSCVAADSGRTASMQAAPVLEEFERVVEGAIGRVESVTNVRLKVYTGAVQAGLNGANNGSFEARCLKETLESCAGALGAAVPADLDECLAVLAAGPARYHLQIVDRVVDVPDYADPVVPTLTEYKLARKALALTMKRIGLEPGRYELQEAKVRIDAARDQLRLHIEERLESFDSRLLTIACITQHDALLAARRMREIRVRQSRAHEVDYDRLEALSDIQQDLGNVTRNYRYLLEKILSLSTHGEADLSDQSLRELVGLVDWYMVLADASDVLHNEVDVGGVKIDDSFIPEVFYSAVLQAGEERYARELAKIKLGNGIKVDDAVEGSVQGLLADEKLQKAFKQDLGFSLKILLQALTILSQPVRHGISDELAFVYLATSERLAKVMADSIDGLDTNDAKAVVSFLTLSVFDIKRLPGRSVDEADVPFWEHRKRLHRCAIRPLIPLGKQQVAWGAELASRSRNIWLAIARDGILPATFPWPHVDTEVRHIKESIESALEERTEEIFRRHTHWVIRGIDFFRRFQNEAFVDVGDFDALAYWPDVNTVVVSECKYNQPAHSMKDSRRLRDKIFGKNEEDRNGQFSHIRARRQFLKKNREKMIELLGWPRPKDIIQKDIEIYVTRDLHYWMFRPPYLVPTKFVRVDALNSWINNELGLGRS